MHPGKIFEEDEVSMKREYVGQCYYIYAMHYIFIYIYYFDLINWIGILKTVLRSVFVDSCVKRELIFNEPTYKYIYYFFSSKNIIWQHKLI